MPPPYGGQPASLGGSPDPREQLIGPAGQRGDATPRLSGPVFAGELVGVPVERLGQDPPVGGVPAPKITARSAVACTGAAR